MSQNVDAIYDHGVLRPLQPLVLPEGAQLHLHIEEKSSTKTKSPEYHAWLNSLAGRWQGEFVRETEGDFEQREPLN
jgi:predicted DNA-binding antitoxin AbrB/MazE fold protein